MAEGAANRVRALREARGWTQAELAARAGVSRAAVSAVEQRRLTPSVEGALRLARALERRVEDLFSLAGAPGGVERVWAGPAPTRRVRYWQARVGDRLVHVPVEPTAQGLLPHDDECDEGALPERDTAEAERTLLLASCDPAASLLLALYARRAGYRAICLDRSSRDALALLEAGAIHAAGVHLARADARGGNARVVRDALGAGYSVLPVARWESGVALARAGRTSLASLQRARLRWVGREAGSGARGCQDEVLGEGRGPRRLARSHRGVVEALRAGWADAGACLRLVSEDAGLGFVPVRWERYDLCLPSAATADPRLAALIETVRARHYHDALRALPGYRVAPDAGDLEPAT